MPRPAFHKARVCAFVHVCAFLPPTPWKLQESHMPISPPSLWPGSDSSILPPSLSPPLRSSLPPEFRTGCPEPQKCPPPQSPETLTFLFPQSQMGGERLLPAGLSLAHPSGWAGRWGIGPGGHPMGGVSTALAELELSREGGGGSGAPTAHTPHALALCAAGCLPVKAARRRRRSPKHPTCQQGEHRGMAWGGQGWRGGQITSAHCVITQIRCIFQLLFFPMV